MQIYIRECKIRLKQSKLELNVIHDLKMSHSLI
jgi:hypothetical protein